MRAALYAFYTNPKYAKAFEWGKLLTITGSAQIAIQAIGLVNGILIIRMLPTDKYALYTLANTMLGTMTLLADGGISTGVMAQGSKVWQDREKLGGVLATGLELRRKFAIGSLFFALPILAYFLLRHGASWMMCFLILISLMISFYAALSDTLLEIIPKIQQDIKPLQINQVKVSIGRFLLSGVTLFIFPLTFVALLSNAIPRIYGNKRLRKIAYQHVDEHQAVNAEVKSSILKITRRILPGSIYYCLSGQITIWLLSIFGTTTAIAQVGALSRLAMVLNIFSALFATLIIPRFSRLENTRVLLFNHFAQIQLIIVLICISVITIAWLFPGPIIWLLGENYENINTELFLTILGACINLATGVSLALYISKGWVMNPIIAIIISVLPIIFGALIIDVTTVKGVLTLNILIGSVSFLLHTAYGALRIFRLK